MTVNFKFKNGIEVQDKVSGFKGIINCSCIWLNGCRRYSVQPKVKEGETKKPESLWMEEETLIIVSEGVHKKIKPTKTGGPSFSRVSARY